MSVLIIDVDFFTPINDSFGQVFCDQCLIRIAECLQQSVPSEIDAAVRYDGEEFLAVLDGASKKHAADIAQKKRISVSQIKILYQISAIPIIVTVDFCSEESTNLPDANTLIKRADKALYIGKKSSRNCVVGENQISTYNVQKKYFRD